MNPDVTFLHPPNVFDFRERPILWGPINDLVPSKSVFEMYPIGFVSLASTLDKNGFDVSIVNLALKMLKDPGFEPESYIERLDTELIAIDLHWLPHVHGALDLARLCKKVKPSTPVVLGGLSATYYHKEILEEVPEVDFVIRGDSGEIPLLKLTEEITGKNQYGEVPNMSYRSNSEIKVNQISSVPKEMDTFSLDYEFIFESVLKRRNFDMMPFQEFINRPIMAVLTRKGCDQSCPGCGGSSYAYSTVCERPQMALRAPEKVVKDLKKVEEFQTPAFVIGDLSHPDEDYGREIFRLLRKESLNIPVVFEFFTPPSDVFLEKLGKSVEEFSIEMSPESGIEEIRETAGRGYKNDELKRTIDTSFRVGCQQFDLYFMIGLSGQTEGSIESTLQFIDDLLDERPGKDLKPFISPYSPFLDPGSLAFEFPDKYGFTKYATTLMEHYDILDSGFTWKDFLSYRTDAMSRDDIVRITYSAALKLARIKEDHGLISAKKLGEIERKISVSKRMIRLSDARKNGTLDDGQLEESLSELKERLLIDRNELDWSEGITLKRTFAILKKTLGTITSSCKP
ncbi:TIGR04190 family B12-binding domain/radical SAM domain protein [Candidatus Bipolaricaulota bacterium]|nr:TIGR04190 family B12-binding domain/radical SAM domain protein [Candidatus Bipolaricaulota bacterium]